MGGIDMKILRRVLLSGVMLCLVCVGALTQDNKKDQKPPPKKDPPPRVVHRDKDNPPKSDKKDRGKG
jgi:hypothetical protein